MRLWCRQTFELSTSEYEKINAPGKKKKNQWKKKKIYEYIYVYKMHRGWCVWGINFYYNYNFYTVLTHLFTFPLLRCKIMHASFWWKCFCIKRFRKIATINTSQQRTLACNKYSGFRLFEIQWAWEDSTRQKKKKDNKQKRTLKEKVKNGRGSSMLIKVRQGSHSVQDITLHFFKAFYVTNIFNIWVVHLWPAVVRNRKLSWLPHWKM